MKITTACTALLSMAALSVAHMEMKDPPPFKSKYNKNAGSDVDYSMTAPLEASGSNFPCKGYHKAFGTPAGKPVAEWTPGETYKMTITGGAAHGGGSCQASLSFDKGSTWKVIHSYIGNCPVQGESSYSFTLPSDTPSGDVIFAWTWFNKIGNREMYMNCAAITVKGRSAKRGKRASSTAMSARPAMFVANVGGDTCTTIEMTDLDFPNPGPDVDRNTQVPKGPSCPNGGSGGANPPGGSDSGSSGNSGNSGNTGSSGQSSAVAPAPSSASLPGGVFVTTPVASKPTSSAVANNPPPAVSTQPAQQPSQPTTTPAPAEPAPSTGGNTGSGSTYAVGTVCTQDGQWNCIGGKQFQRCASGLWSPVMPLAAGTSCSPGLTMNMAVF